MSKSYNVAVVGATGAVGVEMIKTLEKRHFPVKSLKLLASAKSVGKKLPFKGEQLPVEELKESSFKGVDIALFSAGATRSREFAPAVKKAGAVMIDNSSAFRMAKDVPLVVPEINAADIKTHQGIIANPNCTAIIMLMALYPLYRVSRIRRVIVSTYQAASGAGAKAMEELQRQTQQFLGGKPIKPEVFPHPIAFNLFSHNTAIAENGYNDEENKVVKESQKILHDPEIRITPTCIRVPVLRAHAESITAEFEKKITVAQARDLLAKAPGVRLVDDRAKNHFPMPIEASGQDDVLVGRIREDLSCENGLCLFVAGDQLLKGAALNAVQIAERL
jgi:aspartate-semialdehyde dehydrogenase